jgi:putative ABC transport system substrate-binding protein
MAQKLLELLREVAPPVRHIGLMGNSLSLGTRRFSSAAGAAARHFDVEVTDIDVREPADIEPAIVRLGREPDRGLIVWPDPVITGYRKLIIELTARYRVPAVYGLRTFTSDGGLISYAADLPDLFRQAAGYADRILKGEKPGELPVQFPTKFELVINLKTARALSLEIPPSLLARADEVIE